jgi:conserved hypothetical protein
MKILRKIKEKLNIILLLSFTILVLYFTMKDDFVNVVKKLFNLNVFWILVSIFLVLGFVFFKALGTKALIKQKYKEYRFRDAFMMLLSVHFFNYITPYSAGGHPAGVRIMNKEKIKISDATNYTIQMFLVYQIALVIIQSISVFIIINNKLFPNNVLINTLGIIGLGIDIAIVIVLFLFSYSKRLKTFLMIIGVNILYLLRIVKDKQNTLEQWNNNVKEFHENTRVLLNNKKEFVFSVACHFLALISLYLVPLVILFAAGDYTSFNALESIITVSCIMMIGDLFPVPGGAGGIEYGFSILFGIYVTGSTLAVILIAWRFVTYYLSIILGLISFNIQEINFKKRKTKED